MTAPVIGRMVHYVSYGSADGRYESVCRAAVVTETRDSGELGLAVLNPTGMFFDRQVRNSEKKHTGGTWHWPCVIQEEKD
jgi:hypothetical protein